jgi:hypothetical protein
MLAHNQSNSTEIERLRPHEYASTKFGNVSENPWGKVAQRGCQVREESSKLRASAHE